MPEHSLKALTALGLPKPGIDSFGVFTICENPDMALASLACRMGRKPEFIRLARQVLGLELPEAGAIASKAPFAAIWVAPDLWFIEAPLETHEGIARQLADGLGGTASVTEQTDAWVRFDVEGPVVGTVFERLCSLDVRRMKTNTGARTTIEHLGCIVLCREAGIRYSVLGPRSAAASLHHALATAAKSAL